jgi:phospholipase/carboxylesterase
MSEQELSFIHRYVPGEGAAASVTLLLLHGTGGSEDDLLGLGGKVLPGAALLSPRGKVLEGSAARFFRRISEGVFDEEDLKRRAHELAIFVREACATYGLDDERIVAVGYSNGANIACGLMLLHPETLRAAVLLRPMVPFEPERAPRLAGRRVLLASGRRDPIATPDQARRLEVMLSAAGAKVSTYWHDGGHELARGDMVAVEAWMGGLVKGGGGRKGN